MHHVQHVYFYVIILYIFLLHYSTRCEFWHVTLHLEHLNNVEKLKDESEGWRMLFLKDEGYLKDSLENFNRGRWIYNENCTQG